MPSEPKAKTRSIYDDPPEVSGLQPYRVFDSRLRSRRDLTNRKSLLLRLTGQNLKLTMKHPALVCWTKHIRESLVQERLALYGINRQILTNPLRTRGIQLKQGGISKNVDFAGLGDGIAAVYGGQIRVFDPNCGLRTRPERTQGPIPAADRRARSSRSV